MCCRSSSGWWSQVDVYKGYATTLCRKSEGRGASRRRFPPCVGVPRPALDTLNGLPPRNFSRQVFSPTVPMTQNLGAVVDGMPELGYSTSRRGPGCVAEKVRSLPRLAEEAGASARPKPARRRCCACVRACPLRVPRRGGAGPPRRKGVGWAGSGGGGGGCARARASANGDRCEGRGGPGGGDDRRRLWPRRRAAAG